MSYMTDEGQYQLRDANSMAAAWAKEDERSAFIRQTYLHLAGAIALFVALEGAIFTLVPAETLSGLMNLLFQSRFGWLGVILAMTAVSWVAQWWALSGASRGLQYLGLLLYVLGQAVIFVPLLYIANQVRAAGDSRGGRADARRLRRADAGGHGDEGRSDFVGQVFVGWRSRSHRRDRVPRSSLTSSWAFGSPA